MSLNSEFEWKAPKRATSELIERQIERHMAQEILTGKLSAGTRLPSTRALAALWSTSCSSVQKALANLHAAGLVERAASRGTFVRSRADRALIGVLIGPGLVESTSWYYRTLAEAVRDKIESEYLSSRIYSGLSQSGEEAPAQARYLELDRRYYNFAGYVEISTSQMPPQARDTTKPSVLHSTRSEESDIIYDEEDAARQIAAALADQRITRSWVIALPAEAGRSHSREEIILAHLAAGARSWARLIRIGVTPSGLHVEEEVHDALLRELSECPPGELPQAIVVCDDVAMRSVVLALLKRGIRIPEEVKLVVLTAERARVYYSVPVTRFCFPTEKTAEKLIMLLKERLAGGAQTPHPILLKGWMEL